MTALRVHVNPGNPDKPDSKPFISFAACLGEDYNHQFNFFWQPTVKELEGIVEKYIEMVTKRAVVDLDELLQKED